MFSLKTIVLAASLFSTVALACPIIERDIAEGAYVTLEERQSGCPAKYNYDQQGRDWGSLCAGWAKCGNGRQQSPINLPANNFAKTHTPAFGFPGGQSVRGEVYNRGFGPEWKPASGAVVPTLRFDGTTYNLLQWHTHTPESEHAFGGNKQRAEIHFVFGTRSTAKAVAGIGIQYGAENQFFKGLFDGLDAQGKELPPVGSKDGYNVSLSFQSILSSTHFRDYWTYQGSLTTPNCSEGLRWFVGGWTTTLSGDQFPRLNKVSIDSVRALQPILDQGINV